MSRSVLRLLLNLMLDEEKFRKELEQWKSPPEDGVVYIRPWPVTDFSKAWVVVDGEYVPAEWDPYLGLWGGWVPKVPDEPKHLCDSCGRDASEAMTDMHDDGIDYQCPCGHDWTEYYNVVPEGEPDGD
jgi:hypothetical protein